MEDGASDTKGDDSCPVYFKILDNLPSHLQYSSDIAAILTKVAETPVLSIDMQGNGVVQCSDGVTLQRGFTLQQPWLHPQCM